VKSCCRKIVRETRKAIIEQTMVHQRQIAAFALELTMLRESLRSAMKMISASQRKMWTPADDQRLEELRKLI